MSIKLAWDFVVLNPLSDGKPKHLKSIYLYIEEQRQHGGDPYVCPIYYYDYYLFEEDDKKLQETCENCKSGTLLCGDHKKTLATKVKRFLKEHQKKREKARDVLDDFLFKPS